MQQDKNRSVYTVAEVAEKLGVGKSAAYALVNKSTFKTVRIGTAIRISAKSFDEWLEGTSEQ